MKHYKKVKYKLMVRRWVRRAVLLTVVILGGVLAFAVTVGTGVPAVDGTAGDVVAGAQDTIEQEPVNESQVERDVHRAVNQERTERGLSALDRRERIGTAARSHSEDMAERDYYSHTSPDGEDFGDRYRRAGVSCSRGGAENIAWTLAGSDVRTASGGSVNYHRNETAIAQGLVRQWMNSPGHRDIILTDRWRSGGVGIATAETENGTRVLATHNFC